jgi:hypothetical protein
MNITRSLGTAKLDTVGAFTEQNSGNIIEELEKRNHRGDLNRNYS